MISKLIKRILSKIFSDEACHFILWSRHRFGTLCALGVVRDLVLRTDGLARISFPGILGSIFLRPACNSDISVFEQVFFWREYDISLDDVRTIVDAGANIGLFSVLMANRFPSARILAIEPSEENVVIIQRNTGSYRNIQILRAALMEAPGSVSIINPDAEPWAFRVERAEGGSCIPAVTMDDVFSIFGRPTIDVLKLDIEGSERDLLLKSGSWIDRVDMLVVELHDRIVEGCTEALEGAIKGRDFVRQDVGENIVLSKAVGNCTVMRKLSSAT